MLYKDMIEVRKTRGIELAKSVHITRYNDKWFVPSSTGVGAYKVEYDIENPKCECHDFIDRNIRCKHIWAVQTIITKEIDEEGNTTIRKLTKVTYSQDWKNYDKSQTQQKELFMKLLADLCRNIPQPQYVFGRPKLPLSDMIFASALKVFTTFSLRRFASDMRTAKKLGYIQITPCFASVGHFIQEPEVTPLLKELIKITSLPLKSVEEDFAVDSSGFTTTRFVKWFDYKWGKEKDVRVWIKAHMMCGVRTNVITSVELTATPEHDSKFLPQLVAQTSQNFQIREVSGDKAYSTKANLQAISDIGAMPYIPFKMNVTGKARGSLLWKKMWHYFMFKQPEFLQHYHKRSNAETVFHMIKSKFGDAVRSKSETAQINEVLLKILCHNICVVIQEMNELGIESNFFSGGK